MPVPVAIDVTPLAGSQTGIAASVAHLLRAFGHLQAGPQLVPYALSLRARSERGSLPAGTRFPPIPARVLLQTWGRAEVPRIDRWLRPARVLHATNYLTPPSALPTIVTVNDCTFVRHPGLCSEEVLALVPIVRRALRRGAWVHVPSAFVRDEVLDVFGADTAVDRVRVIPWGVPPVAPPTELPAEVAGVIEAGPYVLAMGTIEPRKNLAHLVAAFGAVAAAGHDELRLVLAGPDGPARPDVDAAIARLPAAVAERVVLTGLVSEAGRAALLARARILAYPSIYEGFGFPALEAMSVGVPVVAARAGSIPEVVGDAAELVSATDEAALAEALGRLSVDEARRTEMAARGHDRAQRYSWDTTAHEMAALYRHRAEQP